MRWNFIDTKQRFSPAGVAIIITVLLMGIGCLLVERYGVERITAFRYRVRTPDLPPSYYKYFDPKPDETPPVFWTMFFIIAALHLRFLSLRPRLTVRSARVLALIFAVCLMGAAGIELEMHSRYTLESFYYHNSSVPGLYGKIAMIVLALPGLVFFSIPGRALSLLPLLALYFLIGFGMTTGSVIWLALIMAGLLFPSHRRLRALWRPEKLPRLRASRNSVTLIELLIVIAIIAIFAGGIANLTSQSHRSLMIQHDWRDALALAEDEIALLRAAPEAPAPGRYGAHELLADRPFAKDTVVEIKPGPTPRLREARVTVHIHAEYEARDVTLAALIENGGK
ncbi:MAG: type II secretion system protein GspI [Candidatus Sumerlaeota bacterium]|nr:type II secretion system protein GspI [Candidatus Sumerlaeota bacterium]